MEIHSLKQHYVFRTLCKTNKIGYFSLSFYYKDATSLFVLYFCVANLSSRIFTMK